MDPVTIASSTIALLTPYLAKMGEEVSKKVVGAAWEKVTEIHKAVKDRLAQEKDEYPKETLKRYEKEPVKRKQAMQETLAEVLEKDPAFAQKLVKMLKDADKAGAGTVFNTNVFGGEVGEIINIDTLQQGLTINKKK
jgi:predicted nucleotidyltransferase